MGSVFKTIAIVVGCYIVIDQYGRFCKRQDAKASKEG
jgi:hypothetical protein